MSDLEKQIDERIKEYFDGIEGRGCGCQYCEIQYGSDEVEPLALVSGKMPISETIEGKNGCATLKREGAFEIVLALDNKMLNTFLFCGANADIRRGEKGFIVKKKRGEATEITRIAENEIVLDTEINYCPMCGRRLKARENE